MRKRYSNPIERLSYMLRSVILDFDGTLNTSKRYYARFDELALQILAEQFGCTIPDADRKITEVKRKSLSLTKALLSLNIDSDEFYRKVAEQMDMAYLLDEDLRIEPLISTLRSRNLRVALLTNSGRFLIKKVLTAVKCPSEIFDAVITSTRRLIYQMHCQNAVPIGALVASIQAVGALPSSFVVQRDIATFSIPDMELAPHVSVIVGSQTQSWQRCS